MTATQVSLADLRAAYTALQADSFPAPAPNTDPQAFAAPALKPAAEFGGLGRAVGVFGVCGGVGATTVALAAAELLGASRLIEFSDPQSSGLATASTAELGLEAGWNVGVRHGLRLERRTTPRASLLPHVNDRLSVLDLGTRTGPLPAEDWVARVMVTGCSVPGVRRLNARLDALDAEVAPVMMVIAGVPGRKVPKQVAGAFGSRLRAAVDAGRVLVVPECPALRISGLTADPLPRSVRMALAPLMALLEDTR